MKNEFEKEVKEFITHMSQQLGFCTLTTRIITELFLEPEEITMEELAKRTGYGLSTISTKMKFLTNIGGVIKKRKPGDRKIYYYMEKDIRQLLIMKIQRVMQIEIIPVKTQMPGIIARHKKTICNKGDEREKAQLEIVERYTEQIKALDSIIKDLVKKVQEM